MLLPLLDLPPELLIQVLATLPVKSLLKFAQTSRYARVLAYSNLQSLSLAIFPSHRFSWYNKLISAQHEPNPSRHPEHDPHKVLIRIPQAWSFDYSTLLNFHNKIIASVLSRHSRTLKKLDLTLWALSIPIVEALIALPALRSLSIRIESGHSVPRANLILQRKEERDVWSLIASAPTFTSQLRTLEIESAEINSSQLSGLLSGIESGRLRELKLNRCDMLTSSIWEMSIMKDLQRLSVADCVNVHLNETSLETISNMHKLQVRQPHS
ncbi:hypothetical protein EKO04_003067 [Ascochyta lentis]|uniref:F-box domain-containing protein n=1 Tax=Ascochyta lentis TaxID=205686 RepID=A0A8H7J9Y0_9PLEO|nr:hypothetical protein EKO04_003067 [Ascochyta lentis]